MIIDAHCHVWPDHIAATVLAGRPADLDARHDGTIAGLQRTMDVAGIDRAVCLGVALLVPLLRAGRILFRAPPLPFKLADILAMIRVSPGSAIRVLWVATLHAIVAWLIVAVPMIFLLNAVLRPTMRRVASGLGALKRSATEHAAGAPAEAAAAAAAATSPDGTGKP